MNRTDAVKVLGPLASRWRGLSAEQQDRVRAGLNELEREALAVYLGETPETVEPESTIVEIPSTFVGDPAVAQGWANRPRPTPPPAPEPEPPPEQWVYPDPMIAAAWANRPIPPPYVAPAAPGGCQGCVSGLRQGPGGCRGRPGSGRLHRLVRDYTADRAAAEGLRAVAGTLTTTPLDPPLPAPGARLNEEHIPPSQGKRW